MSARAAILPVFVPHAGCPHACVFCNQRRISGAEKPMDAETIRELLASIPVLAAGEKRQLAFYGGSFTAIPEKAQTELLQAARDGIERGLFSSVRLSTRPDAVNPEILDRLIGYGVDTVELGAQSMDDEVLRQSGRGHTADDVRRAARLVRRSGLTLILQMMTGLPGDSEESCVRSAEELIALRPDGVRIYPTVVVRDTPLYELWLRGEYREHTVEDAVRVCARILPLFEEVGIPVIRLGLNPTEELSRGGAVAGAYHPALGELVKARVMLNRARALLEGIPAGSRVIVSVPDRLLSQFVGQHRENLNALSEEFRLEKLAVLRNQSDDGEIRLLSVESAGSIV